MKQKVRKLKEYLEETNFDIFDLQCVDGLIAFKHIEMVNGTPIQSIMVFDDSAAVDTTFLIANCTDVLKQERIMLFLNELNAQHKLKYYISESGNIIATFTYWASNEEELNPKVLMNLYVVFFKSLIEDNTINKIMKIIWA